MCVKDIQSQSTIVDELVGCLEKFVCYLPERIGTHNVASYLSKLNSSLEILKKEEIDNDISTMLKKQIEHVCVVSEVLFTENISESSCNGCFLYSCSSLIDKGITEYLSSPGWLILLRAMKQSAKKNGGKFLRVFFIKIDQIKFSDLLPLEKIIILHLKNGIEVCLLEDDQLNSEYRQKRNMAWLNGKVLINATNQIDWDLDITKNTTDIDDAREKYNFFMKKSVFMFFPNKIHEVKEVLLDIFNLKL